MSAKGEPHDDHHEGSDTAAAADFALIHRPSFSIRWKIAISFLVCFIVIGGIILSASLTVSSIERSLYFLELADRYTSHVQQARRYEKNYFLYGTNLADAEEHVRAAQETLSGAPQEIERVVGAATRRAMIAHLQRYTQLLGRLKGLDPKDPTSGEIRNRIEAELREHGSEMVKVALRVVDAERLSVRRRLRLARIMPMLSLVVLLVLIIYVTSFLARQILGPLGRMVKATTRIAEGDYTPMLPARRYRDEFTGLALAINRMMHEIDRRQEALAESQKLRAVGTLTAGVAHELNNPINNISLTAEALLEDYEDLSDEDRVSMCRDLLDQAERAHGVVANLLDFSRQRDVHVEPLDMRVLLRETTKLVGNQVKLARVQLEITVADHLPRARGDRQQLRQVLVNLYLNALDAMPQGGELRVHADLAPGDVHMVRIQVADTGSGIPEEVLAYIFDPFFTTKGAKGTGLGLAVSYGIINKHGGSIDVESTPEEGTTFTIMLPVASEDSPADPQAPDAEQRAAGASPASTSTDGDAPAA